ncbi:MAG: sugar phosphate isomerase/epimerase [Acidobacteriaceae bacterium]|nr:sugar phosphate isomerase/epimerase [Acidobacteriaceae bacterium]
MKKSRRDALKIFALSSGAAERLWGAAQKTTTAGPKMDFPGGARDRLAVTSWPFRGYMESAENSERNERLTGMDMTAFPSFVAETFGVYNINPLVKHFASTDADYLKAFRTAVEKAHSRVVDLGLTGGKFYDADAAVRAEAIAAGRKWIDLAMGVGSPSVRQHIDGRGKPVIGIAAESLGQLAAYGEKKNVVVNLENDNPVAEDPFFLVAVIEKVNSPYLRALPDFGNCLTSHDAEFNIRAMQAMLPHAWNMCHVKDSVKSEDETEKTVDLKKMFELAKDASYRGYFSMELDISSGDAIPGTKRLIDESLQYLT